MKENADYEAYKKAYAEKCKECSNTGIKPNNEYCDCTVGMSESLMFLSVEVDKLLERK